MRLVGETEQNRQEQWFVSHVWCGLKRVEQNRTNCYKLRTCVFHKKGWNKGKQANYLLKYPFSTGSICLHLLHQNPIFIASIFSRYFHLHSCSKSIISSISFSQASTKLISFTKSLLKFDFCLFFQID